MNYNNKIYLKKVIRKLQYKKIFYEHKLGQNVLTSEDNYAHMSP